MSIFRRPRTTAERRETFSFLSLVEVLDVRHAVARVNRIAGRVSNLPTNYDDVVRSDIRRGRRPGYRAAQMSWKRHRGTQYRP